MPRAIRLVWQSGRKWSLAAIGLVVVQAGLAVVGLYLTRLVVDAIAVALTSEAPTEDFSQIALLMGAQVAILLGAAGCGLLGGLIQNVHGQIFSDRMHGIIHAKSVEVDLEHYENPRYHDILHRALEDAPFRPTQVLNGLTQVTQHGISFVAMAGLLLAFHWGITLVVFAAALPAIYVGVRNSAKAHQLQLDQTQSERRAGYYHWLLTGDGFVKEMRLLNLGDWLRGRFQGMRAELREARVRLMVRRTLEDIGAQTITMVVVFSVCLFLAYRALQGGGQGQGGLGLGDLAMFFLALRRAQGHVDGGFRGVSSLYENGLFLSNLYELLELKSTIRSPKTPFPYPRPIEQGIVFENVSFQYPAGTRECLRNVNLTIKPGEKVALVGVNGSGKTTLVKLLCRLYDPGEGRITIDGIDLHDLGVEDLRGDISVVFQDFVQYHMTARENVWLGQIEGGGGDDEVEAAARLAGADEFIRGLPQGYDTMLGKWFDEGEELSIGEWQKIALARAFFRESQIIVLDEPTSAMDAKAELEFFDTFQKLAADKTALLISHRFSTVKSADYICVLDDGAIIEVGSHDALMALGGRYAEMFEIQSRQYR